MIDVSDSEHLFVPSCSCLYSELKKCERTLFFPFLVVEWSVTHSAGTAKEIIEVSNKRNFKCSENKRNGKERVGINEAYLKRSPTS